MNVLSLFDGMSCGQIALSRAGIAYDAYYASEIDKHAMAVTQKNYPSTKQIGDVTKISAGDLPRIDLLLGGSPCQGFSSAGNKLNFADPRSKLFFEFIRLLSECKPKFFLFENVMMNKEHEKAISDLFGCEPIMIDSSLVSAQSRKRLYWTNIPNITLPKQQNIELKDIVESGGVLRAKSQTVLTTLFKENAKSMVKRNKQGLLVCPEAERGLYRMKNTRPDARNRKSKKPQVGEEIISLGNEKFLLGQQEVSFRKFTALECERLQTVPEGYTKTASTTQRYRMLGNGWTVDVIAHILSHIPRT